MPGLPNGFSNLSTGQTTMDGSAVQLTDALASEVILTALKANSAALYVGGASVASGNGLEIAPGNSVTVHVAHVAMLYASGANGDKLSWLAAY